MDDVRRQAINVLTNNARNGYTAPARGLYTHQHLWDTCFIAIGQRHYDVQLAMTSMRRLLSARWRNGMIPHIVFEPGPSARAQDFLVQQRLPSSGCLPRMALPRAERPR
jgi:hypothetical protein